MRRLVLAAVLVAAPGCTSLFTIGMARPYSGTQLSLELLNRSNITGFGRAMLMFDLPLSMALDTGLLPFKSWAWLRKQR